MYLIISKKSVFFFKKWWFCWKYFGKKGDFFSCDFDIFMAALDVQQNFMPTRYLFFLSTSFWSKVIAFLSKSCQSWTYYLWLQLTESRYLNKLKKTFSSFHKGPTTFLGKNDLLKVFPVPGNFGSLWYITWQLCCGNNSNDLGIGLDILNTPFSVKICVHLSKIWGENYCNYLFLDKFAH